ncbi:short-chain dehydrogenase [Aliivibrio sp. 1S165]|nr:short-chain dehydrogenase [Aliivibrio sp. 1S165]OCH34883.1 short-chain dehydrogenase [Aliivibrio sp. 1S175]
MMNITDKAVEEKIPPVLRLGFRPFFLLGSIYAIIAITVWVWAFQTGQPSQLTVPALWWHVHEMLFGFSMAIVAGFVLSAVQNWTGVKGTSDKRLGFIVLLWVLPRVLFWTATPLWIISSIEALFMLAIAYEVGFRVIKTKGVHNFFFIPLFLVAIAANFASYATIKGMPPFTSAAVWESMLWWFTLLISVMGARVIPFFTARRFQFEKAQPVIWLEALCNIPLAMLFILSFFPLTSVEISPYLMVIAGTAQLIRMASWKGHKTLSEPLVWSLHAGYLCIPLSLLIRGLTNDFFISHTAIHLFAIGALGGVILAMIARVTMGHTGREIYKGPVMWPAFSAIILAAVVRSGGVILFPEYMIDMINLAAVLWAFAFGLFVWHFGPMLCKKRVDGHPG